MHWIFSPSCFFTVFNLSFIFHMREFPLLSDSLCLPRHIHLKSWLEVVCVCCSQNSSPFGGSRILFSRAGQMTQRSHSILQLWGHSQAVSIQRIWWGWGWVGRRQGALNTQSINLHVVLPFSVWYPCSQLCLVSPNQSPLLNPSQQIILSSASKERGATGLQGLERRPVHLQAGYQGFQPASRTQPHLPQALVPLIPKALYNSMVNIR